MKKSFLKLMGMDHPLTLPQALVFAVIVMMIIFFGVRDPKHFFGNPNTSDDQATSVVSQNYP